MSGTKPTKGFFYSWAINNHSNETLRVEIIKIGTNTQVKETNSMSNGIKETKIDDIDNHAIIPGYSFVLWASATAGQRTEVEFRILDGKSRTFYYASVEADKIAQIFGHGHMEDPIIGAIPGGEVKGTWGTDLMVTGMDSFEEHGKQFSRNIRIDIKFKE